MTAPRLDKAARPHCCPTMTEGLNMGLLLFDGNEVLLAGRRVADIDADDTASRTVTGRFVATETTVTFAINRCPWCGRSLPRMPDFYLDWPDDGGGEGCPVEVAPGELCPACGTRHDVDGVLR